MAWMSGATRRVIESMVDRLAAGDSHADVMADFPDLRDEHGHQPDLKSVERLRTALRELVASMVDSEGEPWEEFSDADWQRFSKAFRQAKRVLNMGVLVIGSRRRPKGGG